MQERRLAPQTGVAGWKPACTPASLHTWFSSVSPRNFRKVMYLKLCHYRLLPWPSLLSSCSSSLILCFFPRFSASASPLSIPSTGWFREGPKLVHIDRAIIWATGTGLGGWFGFPPPGDTGRQDAPCSRMLEPAWQVGFVEWSKWHKTGRQPQSRCC